MSLIVLRIELNDDIDRNYAQDLGIKIRHAAEDVIDKQEVGPRIRRSIAYVTSRGFTISS